MKVERPIFRLSSSTPSWTLRAPISTYVLSGLAPSMYDSIRFLPFSGLCSYTISCSFDISPPPPLLFLSYFTVHLPSNCFLPTVALYIHSPASWTLSIGSQRRIHLVCSSEILSSRKALLIELAVEIELARLGLVSHYFSIILIPLYPFSDSHIHIRIV